MRKSFLMSVAVVALLAAAATLLPLPSRDASAQSTGIYINAVDLDIVPAQTAKFLEAVKENGEFAVKERWIDTLRGRLGFKFGEHDQFLLYVTGGVASASVISTTCLPGVFCTSASNTMTGSCVKPRLPDRPTVKRAACGRQ